MREAQLDTVLRKRVQRMGGMCERLAPITKGIPDRLVLLPSGLYFVELKTDTGKLSEAQKVWHRRARDLGANVEVLYGLEDIMNWLEKVGEL